MKFVHEVCQVFAARLRELRIEKQLTQEQLGKNLGVSRGSISFYENCDRVPDMVFLVTTANYFGVDVRYLLGLTDVRTIDANLQQTKKPTVCWTASRNTAAFVRTGRTKKSRRHLIVSHGSSALRSTSRYKVRRKEAENG